MPPVWSGDKKRWAAGWEVTALRSSARRILWLIALKVGLDPSFEDSLGLDSMLFLTGNFPNPMTVPAK
jgi:hypothetical protein